MTAQLKSLPGTFPLHEDKPFLSESEWVILKLLCQPLEGLAKAKADELSQASGGQIPEERCRELIAIARISNLPGLGSWMARLLVESGSSEQDVLHLPAGELIERINTHMGYTICNHATSRAIAELQESWREEAGRQP